MTKAFTIYQNEAREIQIRDARLPETADYARNYANEGFSMTVLNAETEEHALDIALKDGFAATLDELLETRIKREFFMRDIYDADWHDTQEMVEKLQEQRNTLKGFLKKPECVY